MVSALTAHARDAVRECERTNRIALADIAIVAAAQASQSVIGAAWATVWRTAAEPEVLATAPKTIATSDAPSV